MCFGTLQIAQGIGSTLLGAASQDAQAERVNTAYVQNAQNANASADEQYAQNYLRQIQEEAAAVQERLSSRIQTARNIGTALASTQNGGTSTWNTLTDIQRQGSRDVNAINTNLENKISQIRGQTTAIAGENEQRINSMPTASGSDPLATAISGLGVAINLHNDMSQTSLDIGNGAQLATATVSDWRDGGNAPMDSASTIPSFNFERAQRTK